MFGPYEYKVVMRQGDSPVNGPHQGAWVDTVTGQDWFIHFQDVYAAGRITHLQPMSWENDWPVIGVKKDGNDYGEPVMEYENLMSVPFMKYVSQILQMNSQKILWDCSGSGTPILIVTGHSLALMKAEMCLMTVLI